MVINSKGILENCDRRGNKQNSLLECFKRDYEDGDIDKVVDAMLRGERNVQTRLQPTKQFSDQYTDKKLAEMRVNIIKHISTFQWTKTLDYELTQMVNLASQKQNIASVKVRMNDTINAWKEETEGGLINDTFPELSSLLMDDTNCRQCL